MLKKVSIIIIIALLFFSLISVTSTAEGEEINWYSYEEGMQKAKEQDKPIFIDFWAEWCSPCQKMEEEVYPDHEVIETSSEFINIKVNVDENQQLAKEYNVKSIPTLLFLNSEGEVITSEVGYMSSSEIINTMDEVLDYDSSSNSDDESSKQDDQGIANNMGSNDDPFWKSLIFIEIVISMTAAIAIIIFLRKRGTDEA
ncbi:MAG: thioredoxin family protein [Thermoplasmatota archaeon]